VYKMDYLEMLRFHVEQQAEITVACARVTPNDARRFGVMSVDERQRIIGFEEKPATPQTLPDDSGHCLGSMGIYVFNTPALVQLVTDDAKHDSTHDFGRDILPRVIQTRPAYAFPFGAGSNDHSRYWRDIGTIDAYWDANMDLLDVDPAFNLFDPAWPLRTYHAQQPPAKVVYDQPGGNKGMAVNSIVSQGSLIAGGSVESSVLSPGVIVRGGASVSESILMNGVTVGKGARVRRAIVDKNVVIPPGVRVGYDRTDDERKFVVTDRDIVVVPKGVPPTRDFWCASS